MVKCVSKSGLAVAAAVILPTFFISDAAQAISVGRVQPDGAICRELFRQPHDHHGRGFGSTRGAALAKAIKRWSGFTRFEYGSAWGDWGIARRKAVNCSAGRRGWYCKIEGQPCKR